MTTTEPAVASGPSPRDQELAAFRDRVSALARSAYGRGIEGAPALNPAEIDQQRDRMLAALFPLSRERARGTTAALGGARGHERNPFADPDPRIAALHKVASRLEGDRPSPRSDPDPDEAGFAEGLELAISRLHYHAHELRGAPPAAEADPDPLADVRVGDPDPTPEHLAEQRCPAERDQWVCTREVGHVGQHIAGDGTEGVRAVWRGCHACGAGSDR